MKQSFSGRQAEAGFTNRTMQMQTNMVKKIMKLSANENFYGCSPLVKKAIRKKIREVNYYSDSPIQVENILAEKFRLSPQRIAVGAGSVRLIDGIIQSLVEPEDEILTFDKTFVAYSQLAATHNRKCVFAPVSEFTCHIKNLLPFINNKTKVIFIANPNNPTGTITPHEELKGLLQNIQREIYVVIDEAYHEYVTDPAFPDSLSLQKEFSNLIILRTFSKVYGLAGLRIGYAIADEKTVSILKQSRIPHFMNCFSADAAAAALGDEKFIKKSVMKNKAERNYLYKNLKQSGFNVVPSQGNFLYLYFEDESDKMKVYSSLNENGIAICNLTVFGLDKSLRISVGDRKTNRKIVECLK